MPDHEFHLRATFRYGGSDNRIDAIAAQVRTDAGWKSLDLDLASPGFLLFVYSFLVCQHTYFHANATERGVRLQESVEELDLVAAEDWKIKSVSVCIAATLGEGRVDDDTLAYIERRMRQCPVSINLIAPPDYHIDVAFS